MVDRFAETLQTLTVGSQAKTVNRFQTTVLTTEAPDISNITSGQLNDGTLYDQLPDTNVHGT